MTENIKDEQKYPTAEAELSILYVRKKVSKIMTNLSYVNNIYDKTKVKLLKRSHFQILKYKNGAIKCFNDKNQDACLSQNKMFSAPKLSNSKNQYKKKFVTKSLEDFFSKKTNYFKSKFLIYVLPKLKYQNPEYHFMHNSVLKIYRCQLNTNEESCCCSCNSDAMFEVMKSLYDCYKKKNCNNCNCILCGHLPREERRLGELRKSGLSLAKVESIKRKKPKTKVIKKISSDEASEAVTPLDTKKISSDKLKKLKERGLMTPLEGKSSEQKEKILTGLAMNGIPLPKGKSESDKKIIDKVRKDVGLPPEPKTASEKNKYDKAMAMGLITPLLGKPLSKKEKILKGQADLGLPLPEGRTPSEQKLIAKMKEAKLEPLSLKIPSAKLQKSKTEGILTPLQGKTPEEKEKIMKDLAMKGIPLPEGKSESDKKLINKIQGEIGVAPQPKTSLSKEKYAKAQAAGLIVPLEGKTEPQKEKLLKDQAKLGLSLPEGRTQSEKALIAKVKAQTPTVITIPSDKIKSAKGAGILTPLHGKTSEQKEAILKGLAMHNIPLPKPKTPSEKFAVNKVRKDLGLPPEPKSKKEISKYNQALAAGLITPLEGKSQSEKEKILQGQVDLGLQLPEGRSPSEKALIKNIKSKKKKHRGKVVEGILSPDKRQKLDNNTRKVLKEGKGPSDECICSLISPESDKILEVKSMKTKTKDIKHPSQKEKIIRELAKQGAPLPEPKTHSEKKILDKVQADLGLPLVPTTPSLKEKYTKAQKAGIIVPLEGKTQSQKEIILKKQAEMGITLPEGRTPSEKALVKKIRTTVKPERIASEKLQKLKEAGLLTPLTGKSPDEQIKILRNIAKAGLPLPEGKTPSEKQIVQKVKDDMGLPSKGVPSEIFRKAKAAGLITPLGDKTQAQKEKILKDRLAMGLPLPDGVTPSDKQLIKKIKISPGYKSPKISSSKLKKTKTADFLRSLEGKSPSQKEKLLEQQINAGLPLPKVKTRSEKELIKKIQAKRSEGKPASQKEKKIGSIAKQGTALPEAKTVSEKAIIDKMRSKEKVSKKMKALSEKIRIAKAAGLLTPLEGKSPEQKEKVLRGLAKAGIPLPEGKSTSEKKLIEKVREEVGLPPEPKTSSMKNKMKQAHLTGIITPLEGKTSTEKEKILKKLQENGIPLPKGRTASEKSLIKKIKAGFQSIPRKEPSTKIEKQKAEDLLAQLKNKTPAQKEKVIREFIKSGRPLPEGKTYSEKALINKIETEKGLLVSPEKVEKLDKKTAKVLKEAKGPSDECICHILSPEVKKEKTPEALRIPSEKLRKAKDAGLLTPLQGKSMAEKEKILKGLAMQGIPLPEAKTSSDKRLINKVRADVGLPPEPKTPSLKEKYNKAMAAGLITPLQGKSSGQKEKIIKGQAQMGLPLPEGRTPSERALIEQIKTTTSPLSRVHIAPERAVKTKVSLEGKSPEEKEKILRNLALQGAPLPDGKTTSDKKILNKIRADIGLPPEPRTKSVRKIYDKAVAAGYITPLQGKTHAQKENILRRQAELGIPLPEGRTSTEKDLIARIKQTVSSKALLKQDKRKQTGLLTPMERKTLQKTEQIPRNLAEAERQTPSEKLLIQKVKPEYEKPHIATLSEKRSKIKTKSKKIGVASDRRSGKRLTQTKGAITEEFQDILKTTTCEKGCGCDKKKIRFKHSYVKIRVTSPDISSLCPCPEECLPGVKGGVFTDNEGIKVTVGRVLGTPSFSRKSFLNDINFKLYKTLVKPSYAMLSSREISSRESASSLFRYYYNFGNKSSRSKSKSETKIRKQSRYVNKIYHKSYSVYSFDPIDIESYINNKHINLQSLKASSRTKILHEFSISDTSQDTSFDSIYLLNRNSSVSLVTLPDSISVISFSTADSSSSSSFCKLRQNLRDYEIIKNYSLFKLKNSTISVSTTKSVCNNTEELFKYSANRKSLIFKSGYNICMFEINKINVRNSLEIKHSSNKTSNITVDKVDVQKLPCRILSREQLLETSSVIIVMYSSSDEHNPQYIPSIISSSIGLDVLEKNCSWNYKEHSLLHLHQNQRGFKIATTGRTLNNNIRPTINDLYNNHDEVTNIQYNIKEKQKDFFIKDYKERKHRTLKIKENCRIISTDTTQDRPCCCEVKDKLHIPYDVYQNRMDNIVTEMVTPIILKGSSAQSLCHESNVNSSRKKVICQKRQPGNHSNPGISTDPCCTVPCYRPSTQLREFGNKLLSVNATNNTLKTCECDPQKLEQLFDKKTKEMLSKACNISYEKLLERKDSSKDLCNNCGSANKSYEKKLNLLCPCEQHYSFSEKSHIEDQQNYNKKCKCDKQKRLKKNIICECPEEPEPEIDLSEWVDEKQMRKLKSELTQTRSGFKMNKPRKKNDLEQNGIDFNFEELLKYIAENLEEESNKNYKGVCACSNTLESKSKKSTNCECPYEEPPSQIQTEQVSEEGPFTGIKFHINGKGSVSKGLNGILCFELLNDFSLKKY